MSGKANLISMIGLRASNSCGKAMRTQVFECVFPFGQPFPTIPSRDNLFPAT
jgi:hypothetical protein